MMVMIQQSLGCIGGICMIGW